MRHLFILCYAWLVECYRRSLMMSNSTMKLIFIPGINGIRAFSAKARAYSEFVKARKRVPAYRAFLAERGFSKPSFKGLVPNISDIPFTDKENYVKRFSIDDRCVSGKVPACGVVIDESSGSSGIPMNWVRGAKERKTNARFIRFGMRHFFGDQPIFIINAFALGPWATGVNVTMSCVIFSKLKSLGPDKAKIENTIRQFGHEHTYVIMGYPPFLKMLVDNSDINWQEYNISFIFGGEPMSEGMRTYLQSKGIRRIYSSLGASDLELNISTESDFTISLRRLLSTNEQLKKRILKYPGALPMIFQYNPVDFLLESTQAGELVVTVCRPGYLAPKIRYNLHDRGQVMALKELYCIFKELGIDTTGLSAPATDLPLLFHYGRADMTVAFFGSKISPVDIQETLESVPELSGIINSFCINASDDEDGDRKLTVFLELKQQENTPSFDITAVQTKFYDQLAEINQDFREARRMATKQGQAIIGFYPFGQGPFTDNDIRIKAKYIQ